MTLSERNYTYNDILEMDESQANKVREVIATLHLQEQDSEEVVTISSKPVTFESLGVDSGNGIVIVDVVDALFEKLQRMLNPNFITAHPIRKDDVLFTLYFEEDEDAS